MSTSKNVNELFNQAHNEGTLSAQSMQTIQILDPGAQINNALGIKVDDVQASEVVLVSLLVDDSGSIRFAGNADVVREGHNGCLDALSKSKQKDNVLVHTRYLNGQILYPYCALDGATKMDTHNYNPNGGTPLNDETVTMLATVLAKCQEFKANGVPCRTVTLIVTDGRDEHSHKTTVSQVAHLVKDMLMQETHIIAAMGIDDGVTNFKAVFSEMGIRPEWILTPANTQSDIRKAFGVFSQSAVRASQSAASFSKTAGGGLGGFTA
jgi:hypothetical protein